MKWFLSTFLLLSNSISGLPRHFNCDEIGRIRSDFDVWPAIRCARIRGFQCTSNHRNATLLKVYEAIFLKIGAKWVHKMGPQRRPDWSHSAWSGWAGQGRVWESISGSICLAHFWRLSWRGKVCAVAPVGSVVGSGVGYKSSSWRTIGQKNEMKVTSNALNSSEQNFLRVFVSIVQRVALKWKTLGEMKLENWAFRDGWSTLAHPNLIAVPRKIIN